MTTKLSSKNAIKHGITAKKHSSANDRVFPDNLVSYFSKEVSDQKCLDISGNIAEIQVALASVRREKARVCSEILSSESQTFGAASSQSTYSTNVLSSTDVSSCVLRLITLDEYERKLISRRRKLGFGFLLAREGH